MKKADLNFVFFPYYSEWYVVAKGKVQPRLEGEYERIYFNYTGETKPMKVFPLFFIILKSI